MTVSVNTTVKQYGTWRTSGVSNETGGKDSSPTPIDVAPVIHTSMTVSTVRSGGRTAGFNKRDASSPRLKPQGLNYSRSVDVSEAGYRNSHSLLPTTTYGYFSQSTSGVSQDTSNIPNAGEPSVGEIAACSDKASSRLLKSIKNQVFNAAQAMAERKQTANLIATTAVRFASSIRHLRKGDFASAANALGVASRKRAASRFKKAYARRQGEAVSRGWLELQYGWKPLLNDIYGAADTLARKDTQIQYVTRRSSETFTRNLDNSTMVVSNGGKFRSSTTTNGKAKVTVRYSVTYCTPTPTMSLPAQLGLTNPLLIAWELMPFSFVVDWFLPLGQAISNLDATRGAVFYCGHKTVYCDTIASGSRALNGTDTYSIYTSMNMRSAKRKITCVRTPLSSFPSPSLPRFKNPASFLHAANGLALLTQLFRKH